jgi:hypothetical protein
LYMYKGGLLDKAAKNRGPVSQQVWHNKDSSLLKNHKTKFCSPSPTMVMSPYE